MAYKINDGKNFVYHCFSFDPKIREHTFMGSEFIGMESKSTTLEIFDRVVEAGQDGFMPTLVSELQNIFGEDNYVYDGYEIGEDESGIFEFNLYFLIKEKLYKSLLEKVVYWSKYHGIEKLIRWDEKEI